MNGKNRGVTLGILVGLVAVLIAFWSNFHLAGPGPSNSAAAESASAHGSARAGIGQSGAARARLVESYGRLPLRFEANQGQTNAGVKFLSRGSGYTLFLTGTGAVLSLQNPRAKPTKKALTTPAANGKLASASLTPGGRWALLGHSGPQMQRKPAAHVQSSSPAALDMQLPGANPEAKVVGVDELPGRSNYFIGNDPRKWRTNVKNYAKVKYEGVYPGVDLVYYGDQRQLEYDFVVAPGADASVIALALNHASPMSRPLQIDRDGNLCVRVAGSEVVFHKPVVYQPEGDLSAEGSSLVTRHSSLVDGRYRLKGDHEVTFELASYDRSRPLVIDPVLSYSSFLGGSGDDAMDSVSVAVDSAGNAYVASGTLSADLPVTSGGFQTGFGGAPAICDQGVMFCGDAFVTKINAAGTAVVYSTYLGGSSSDYAFGLAVDASGDAYVTGNTESTNFPVTAGVFQSSYGGEQGPICDYYCGDTFVTKLNPSGSGLIYSSYLGGSGDDNPQAITFDSAGNAYVTGMTNSANFPTTARAFQTAFMGNNTCTDRTGANIPCQIAYVTKINPAGTALVYSTYLSGSSSNGGGGGGIAVDTAGRAIVGGGTCDADFPTTSGAYQTQYAGGCDVFLTAFNVAGSGLAYSTYLGGSGFEWAYSLAIDHVGHAYVTGQTYSSNFPATAGAIQTTYGGNGDGFVAKLSPEQSGAASLVYSTYLGGPNLDYGAGVAADTLGNAYATGLGSSGFPVVNSLQAALNGISDAFVAELNPQGTKLVYSTYLGGSSVENIDSCALDRQGNLYAAGWTRSADFPTTSGVFQPSFAGGNRDVFVVKIGPGNSPGVSLVPVILTFSNQAVGTTSPPQTVLLHNVGSATVTISRIQTVGDFSQTNACGSTLAGGGSCGISITFTPGRSGTLTGGLSVSDNAAGSPQRITLTGTGTP